MRNHENSVQEMKSERKRVKEMRRKDDSNDEKDERVEPDERE